MAHRGGNVSISQDFHIRIDVRIDISISIRPLTTKFGNQVHLQHLTQIRLIKT